MERNFYMEAENLRNEVQWLQNQNNQQSLQIEQQAESIKKLKDECWRLRANLKMKEGAYHSLVPNSQLEKYMMFKKALEEIVNDKAEWMQPCNDDSDWVHELKQIAGRALEESGDE